MCYTLLIQRISENSASTILGEECHIRARSPRGPRGGQPSEDSQDSIQNLILLCRNDHRIVDANPDEYPESRIQLVKQEHEERVRLLLDPKRLLKAEVLPPLQNKFHYEAIISGREAFELVSNACAGDFWFAETDNPEIRSDAGEVIDTLKEFGDMLDEIGMLAMLDLESALTLQIQALFTRQWVVLGCRLENRISVEGEILPWPTAVVRIMSLSQVLESVDNEKADS